ncbi:MAG: diguanylate cyclase [Armatimonadetes bacterium]|nr:diguanylate cyclase [Armatimonadota bacterium]
MADLTHKASLGIQYPKGQADALRVLVAVYCGSDPVAANEYAEKAISIYEQLGDDQAVAGLLMQVARFNQNSGWVNRAYFLLAEAYERSFQAENLKVASAALFNLGANSEDRDDFPAAVEYFARAKQLALEHDLTNTYWRAAAAEQEMLYILKDGLFDREIVHKALEALESDGGEECLIELLTFLAKVAHDEGDGRLAKSYMHRSMRLAKACGGEQARAEILYQSAVFRHQEGRLKSAGKALRYALTVAERLELRTLELSCLKLLADTYFRLSDPSLAYETLNRFVEIRDELHVQESKRHFEEMRTMRQFQLVEEESRLLKLKNTALGAVNSRLEVALQETRNLQKELQRLVTIDELTGAFNRREILARGSDMVSRFHSQGRQGSIMIVDIDRFKSINDSFGHATGDEILRRFTKSCQRVLRPTDSFGRLGGEEFCILLDNTPLDIAEKVADRLLKSIRSTRVSDLMGDRVLTASLGLAGLNASHDKIEVALNDADESLYEAKNTGRDKYCVSGVKNKRAA